jgi:hypothetical protein
MIQYAITLANRCSEIKPKRGGVFAMRNEPCRAWLIRHRDRAAQRLQRSEFPE